MKKNNNTLESTRKMNKKSSSIPALTDYIVNILSDILEEKDLNLVQNTLKEHHTYFQNIINNNVSKPKKIKDPNAPKRGKSSYIFFCLDKRQSIIDANPEMSAKEIIKELGRVWREDMSEEDKQQYENKSLADKQRYEEEIANYTPPPGIASKKDSNKPKRGKSAYIFFCSDRRPYIKEENPQLNTKEITSILGKQWKSLSNDEKQPFLELAEEDKQRYEKEKTEWNSSKEDNVTMNYTHMKKVSYKTENVDKSEKKSKKSKKSKKKKNKKSKKKKNKKKSGYILYCQEERDVFQEDYPEMNSQEITKMLASSWKKLSKEEQDDYNERA